MSRMATMQVLNQAFNNLNNAMNTYMQNKNMARRTDLLEQSQLLDDLWRKRNYESNMAQQQWDNDFRKSQADRSNAQQQWLNNFKIMQADLANKRYQENFNYGKSRDKISDAFREREFNANQKQRDLDNAYRLENRKNAQQSNALNDIVSLAQNGASPETLGAYMYASKGDPIAQNLLINSLSKDIKELNSTNNTQKSLSDFMNFYKTMSENSAGYQMEQALDDFYKLKGYLKKGKILNAEDLQNMVNSGEMSRKDAFNYAKSNNLL